MTRTLCLHQYVTLLCGYPNVLVVVALVLIGLHFMLRA
jgi:hypothetical protein